jgi:hypothetical protein
MATVGDLALPEVEGWLLTATEHDPVLTERFPRVNHLIDPPPKLFHPAVLRRESWPGTSAPAHPAVPDLTPSAAGTASP